MTLALVFPGLSRLGLALWRWARVRPVGGSWPVLVGGLLLLPPATEGRRSSGAERVARIAGRWICSAGAFCFWRLLLSAQQRAQHPGGLFVCHQPAGDHVGGAVVADRIGGLEHIACGGGGDLMAIDQLADHLLPFRHAGLLRDRAELAERAVGSGREYVQRADALE